MITPSEIVNHLNTYLPRVTNLFSDLKVVSSASVTAADTITVNSVAHGLSPADDVVISGGIVENGIIAAVLDASGENVILTTATEHDFTAPPLPADATYVTISGFTKAIYNTTHKLTDVTKRTKITIALPTGETLAPTLNGNEIAYEDRDAGLKGFHQVATVPTVDSLTIQFSNIPDLPVGPITGLQLLATIRIAAATDKIRAREMYTTQSSSSKLWAFVVMGDVEISRDRHTFNDGIAGYTNQDQALTRILQNFYIVVYFPISDTLSGRDAQDLAYHDVFTALLSTLFLYRPISDTKIDYVTVPAGHSGEVPDDSSVYEHIYEWQLPMGIDEQDGYTPDGDVAFRDIDAIFNLHGDEEAPMSVNINLDEEQ